MHWSAQPIESPHRVLIVRGYVDQNGAAAGAPFQGQVLVMIDANGVATPYGMLNASGQPLTREDRAAISEILRNNGAVKVNAQRHGRWVTREK